MRRGQLAVFMPLLLASTTILSAQVKVGETVYMEGDVSVVRNADALDPSAVTIGMPIDNFDLMKTGDDGNAQIKVTSPQAPSATVTVSPGTQFTFELSALSGRQRSAFNLISGSFALKVAKLSKMQDLDVQTENTVMGVRGTEFTVSTSISADVLVTCSTGEVVCTAEDGKQYRAIPGKVVENRSEGTFRQIPVAASDLERFRGTWTAERREAARKNALPLIQANVRRYQELRTTYDRDYNELMRQRSIISKWSGEDKRGAIGRPAEIEQEKRSIAATLGRLRQTQFQLERSYYRLLELKTLHDQGYGHGTVSGQLKTSQFFDQLQHERGDIEGHMATVRNVTRLYTRRNNDVDPTSYSQRFHPEGRTRQTARQTSGPKSVNSQESRVITAEKKTAPVKGTDELKKRKKIKVENEKEQPTGDNGN